MPDSTIGGLSEASSFGLNDLFVIEQGFNPKKVSGHTMLAVLRDAIEAHGGIMSITSEHSEDHTLVRITTSDGESFQFSIPDGVNGTNGTDGTDGTDGISIYYYDHVVSADSDWAAGSRADLSPSNSDPWGAGRANLAISKNAYICLIQDGGTGTPSDFFEYKAIGTLDPITNVYVGPTTPTGEHINVWIKTDGDGDRILLFKDNSGEWSGVPSIVGPQGPPGYSTTVSITEIELFGRTGRRITLTDENGPHSFTVMDDPVNLDSSLAIFETTETGLLQKIRSAVGDKKAVALVNPSSGMYYYYFASSFSGAYIFASMADSTISSDATVEFIYVYPTSGSIAEGTVVSGQEYNLAILDSTTLPQLSDAKTFHYPSSYAVASALSQKIGKLSLTATIAATAWTQPSGAPDNWWVASGISVSGLLATDDFIFELQPATAYNENLEAIRDAFGSIYAVENPSAGSVNAYLLGDKPEVDIPVKLLILR